MRISIVRFIQNQHIEHWMLGTKYLVYCVKNRSAFQLSCGIRFIHIEFCCYWPRPWWLNFHCHQTYMPYPKLINYREQPSTLQPFSCWHSEQTEFCICTHSCNSFIILKIKYLILSIHLGHTFENSYQMVLKYCIHCSYSQGKIFFILFKLSLDIAIYFNRIEISCQTLHLCISMCKYMDMHICIRYILYRCFGWAGCKQPLCGIFAIMMNSFMHW